MFNFSNYLGKLIYFVDDSNKLVIGDMKDETGGFAIEKLFGLKQKMQVFVFGREHEKENDVNKNFTATIN